MSKRHRDLQPWLDYFRMLRRDEQEGLLQTVPKEHVAYVTQPALHAMTPGDDPQEQVQSGAILATLRRIRTYCAFQHAHALGLTTYDPKALIDPDAPLPEPLPAKVLLQYEREPFALHVVADAKPNDPIYTILLSLRRRWFWPFRKLEQVEVINYESL